MSHIAHIHVNSGTVTGKFIIKARMTSVAMVTLGAKWLITAQDQ